MADVSLSFPALRFAGATFRVLPCGALHWPSQDLLLLADLHLEKGSAFARRGWLLPPHDSRETLLKVQAAVQASGAGRVAVLGDSFHDAGGPGRMQPDARGLLQAMLERLDWTWITGNHDGASGALMGGRAAVELALDGIALRHEARAQAQGAEISGHYHPKVQVPLPGGRSVVRRCLALAGTRLVLPAYGAYAGGLAVDDPALADALGAVPEALVPVTGGLIRLTAADRRAVA